MFERTQATSVDDSEPDFYPPTPDGRDRTSWLKPLLAVMIVGILGILHACFCFSGYTTPAAMDAGQLARNIAIGRGFVTDVIRPADLWYMKTQAARPLDLTAFPEIRQAPLYPVLLAAAMRITGSGREFLPDEHIFQPERTAALPMGILFAMGAAWLSYRLAAELYGERAGFVAALAIGVTDAVLAGTTAGTPVMLIMLLTTAAFYAGHRASVRVGNEEPFIAWFLPFLLAAILCVLAFLTAYSLLILMPVIMLMIAVRSPRHFALLLTLFTVIFIIGAAPWLMRNQLAVGSLLGSAPHQALNHTLIFEGNAFDRSLEPAMSASRVVWAIKSKATAHFARMLDLDIRTIGSGLFVCLFLVGVFLRDEHADGMRVRGFILLGLGLTVLAATFTEGPGGELSSAFLPLVVVGGTGVLFALLKRLELPDPAQERFILALLVAMTALPALIRITGPGAVQPYPPYHPPFISWSCGLLDKREMICSDIPWATAWYGNRTSVLAPYSADQFDRLTNACGPVAALYLTSESGKNVYTRTRMTRGPETWLPFLTGMIPPGFPLNQGIAFPPNSHDQIFLTAKQLWKAPTESVKPPASTNAVKKAGIQPAGK